MFARVRLNLRVCGFKIKTRACERSMGVFWHKCEARVGCHPTWCGWSINFSLATIELTPLQTLKLKEQLFALLKKAFGASPGAARLGHQPKSGIAACARLCRSALAAGMHDLCERTPVACVLSALNAKAVLASPVRGIFMPLSSRVLEHQQTPVRSPSDLPRIVPSHKPAWVRSQPRCRAHLLVRSKQG